MHDLIITNNRINIDRERKGANNRKFFGEEIVAVAKHFDWLLSIAQQQKIVLFSGSSGRYGYCSEMLLDAFPEYQVANMGVYAFTNAMPQLELIRQQLVSASPALFLLAGLSIGLILLGDMFTRPRRKYRSIQRRPATAPVILRPDFQRAA